MQIGAINGTNNGPNFKGHAFKIVSPTDEMLKSVFMGSVNGDTAVLVAHAGKKGDNIIKDLLQKARHKYSVSSKDYHAEYMRSFDRDVLVRAQIEFDPKLAKLQ